MSNYTNKIESELLSLTKEGDSNAFNELYNRHWEVLFRYAYNLLRDKDVCMDILQEIFAWLWEYRSEWELESCRGYLLTAVRFKATNFIRNNKTKDAFLEKFAKIPKQISYDLSLELEDLKTYLNTFSETLPPRAKEIFQLSRFSQLSNKEIAQKLNISEKTVKNQITISLKKLKSKIGNNMFLLIHLF